MSDHLDPDEFQVPTQEDLLNFDNDEDTHSSFRGFSSTPSPSFPPDNPTGAGEFTSDSPADVRNSAAFDPHEPIPPAVGHILQHLLESNQTMLKMVATQKSRKH